jgi:hypothetical protein
MTDILIRNIPAETVQRLDQLANHHNKSRQEFLTELLTQAANDYDPGVIVGYLQLSGGEIQDDDCETCGTPFAGSMWLGVTAALTLFGPICGRCKVTD